MELLLFLLGVFGGIFAGLIPGIGVFTVLVLLYPLLLDLTILQLLILYIPIISISQYIGSVPALYFKIPGEATSFIATEYGHNLFKKGNYDLIPLTAIGSFVATVLSAVVILLLPMLYENMFYGVLKTNFVFAMILITGVCLVSTAKNNWWVSILLIVFGLLLGNIGFNASTGKFFATLVAQEWPNLAAVLVFSKRVLLPAFIASDIASSVLSASVVQEIFITCFAGA